MNPGANFCPRYLHAVELVGRRWTGSILRTLLTGPARYAEIRGGIPDISDRMLSERLRELEAEGIVVRAVIPESPVRVEYALTEKGRALESAIVAIAEWAERWVSAQISAPESGTSQLATVSPDKKRANAVTPRSRRSKKDGRRKVGGAARI